METTAAFAGLRCIDCDAVHDSEISHRCPDCGGSLDPTYDYDAVDPTRDDLDPTAASGLASSADLLPFPADSLVSLGEGATPLLDCPGVADELGVDSLSVKDEGRNPTGAALDRGIALAVTAARGHDATDVALPSTGNGGQAAAAYAARGGLDSHAFVPSRTPFVNKAMTNVHGGDMSVVEGRFPDAADAFTDAMVDADWHSLAPFQTPFRHEGAKTLAHEIAAQRNWSAPDAVVHPTGHGTGIVGLAKGFDELAKLGLIERRPRLYAAQATGCAPIASAWASDAMEPVVPEAPDTIVGPLEIPDPAGGRRVLDALSATNGGAIATGDDAILDGAVTLAEAGVTMGASGGAAYSGANELAERGVFDGDSVVLINPTTGNKEADILRSHLMSKGI